MNDIRKIIDLLRNTIDCKFMVFSMLSIEDNNFTLPEGTLFFSDDILGHSSSINYDFKIDRAVFFAVEYDMLDKKPFLLCNQDVEIKLYTSDNDKEEKYVSFF